MNVFYAIVIVLARGLCLDMDGENTWVAASVDGFAANVLLFDSFASWMTSSMFTSLIDLLSVLYSLYFHLVCCE